jgi:hypothetical protein
LAAGPHAVNSAWPILRAVQNTSNVKNIVSNLVDDFIRQCGEYQFACFRIPARTASVWVNSQGENRLADLAYQARGVFCVSGF